VATDAPATPPWLAALAAGALWFATAAPASSLGEPPTGLGVVGEVGVVLLLASVGWRRTAAAAWLAVFAFQLVRMTSQLAMAEEGLLIDLLWLLGHVWVLADDWVGLWRLPALGLLLAALALSGAVASRLLRVGSDHPRVLRGISLALVLVSFLPFAPGGWVTLVLVANLSASAELLQDDQALVQEALDHADPYPAGPDAPDVHLYVVESYGALLFRDRSIAGPHKGLLEDLQPRLEADGWSIASGLSLAPVSGGRSWIADASVLLGTPVAHETSYRRLMGLADTLPHLPAWFEGAGYHTVLVRPKDRERPGVELENPLAFDETVFFADLDYEGPRLGWGWVPDQYTLGWLREEVFPGETQRPSFVFTHLVTAHVPWRAPPYLVEDWRTLGTPTDEGAPTEDRTVAEEIGFHLHRFRRGPQGLGADLRSYMQEGDPARQYRKVIAYDLRALTRHTLALEAERPMVVVWMGDHAPPGITARHSFAVPVHVMATDPALLEPFLERGFAPGLFPPGKPALGHHELYEPLTELVPRD